MRCSRARNSFPTVLEADRVAIVGDVYDDAYYAAFFKGSRAVLERRLDESTAAVAAMITGAWEAAGKPAVPVRGLRRRTATPAVTPGLSPPRTFDIVRLMDVFVIPVGVDRYELYYEQTTEAKTDDEPAPTGMLAKWQRRFSDLLRAAEQHSGDDNSQQPGHSPVVDGPDAGPHDGLDRERIAEQRLLWNLRTEESVVAVHPSDTTFEAVMPHIQQALQRDFERHRFWLFIDTAGLVVSGLLAIVPGPNLLRTTSCFESAGIGFP